MLSLSQGLRRVCCTRLNSPGRASSYIRPLRCAAPPPTRANLPRSLTTMDSSGTNNRPKVAVAQMTSTGDPNANYEQCASLARDAKAAGAALLCLPECCSFIGRSAAETVGMMQPLDGPLMTRFCNLAKETGVWLSLGGFQKQGPDDSHLYNCHVIVDDHGEIRGSYDKIHLFSVDIPSGPVLKEGLSTAAGEKVVAVDSPVGKLGLTVCYDLRFPYLYQLLRFKHGAEMMLVPSAFTRPTGEAHWEALLRARAIETQCYVVAAAQAGEHNEKRASYGHALIIDPWGKVVGRCEDPNGVGIAVAEVDLEYVASVRERMPVAEHRVPELLGVREEDG